MTVGLQKLGLILENNVLLDSILATCNIRKKKLSMKVIHQLTNVNKTYFHEN